jgi:hypothetical protein
MQDRRQHRAEKSERYDLARKCRRRSAIAGPQMLIVDLALDPRDNLIAEWLIVGVADSEREHTEFPAAPAWPGHRTSTVMLIDSKTVYSCTGQCPAR